MTRLEIIQKLKEINSHGLLTAVIVFKSSITKEFEERHIYADEANECITWLSEQTKFYKNKGIPFAAYRNGTVVEINKGYALFN